MLVELTYKCSMGCPHCMSDCKSDGIDMPLNVLKDSLEFLIRNDIRVWNFSGGEMFEHENIIEVLNIIDEYISKVKYKFPIIFITNGRQLVRNPDIYNSALNLQRKYSKKRIMIQVTDDERFYKDRLTDKEKYYLSKLGAIIENVPGDSYDKNRCLYPQGRALENYTEEYWYTKGPKCSNVRLLALQGGNTIHSIVNTLMIYGKMCTPVIAPDGSIKLGESALCPSVSSIYHKDNDIIKSIRECKCMKCKIPFDILQKNNPIAYEMLKGDLQWD